jgi:multicomponent Na+:H+ antiporter subunit D
MVLGTIQAQQIPMLVVLLVSSLLNAAYFLPIVYNAFFCPDEEAMFESGIKEAPPWCLVPTLICAVFSILLFFYPDIFLRLSRIALEVM